MSRGEASARGVLGELVEYMSGCKATAGHDAIAEAVPVPAVSYPELAALDDFRRIWSGLRIESHVRQSLTHQPTDAGPLNSSALVHRSIELMREMSPGYLRHFLSYVDDLSSLERMESDGAAVGNGSHRPASIGKRARGKARTRRD